MSKHEEHVKEEISRHALLFMPKREVVKINKLKDFIIKIKKDITKEDKWKIYLYLNGQNVAKVYRDDDATPLNEIYIIRIRGFKHLIGTNRSTKVIVRPYRYKFGDNGKKEVHLECVMYEGVSIDD